MRLKLSRCGFGVQEFVLNHVWYKKVYPMRTDYTMGMTKAEQDDREAEEWMDKSDSEFEEDCRMEEEAMEQASRAQQETTQVTRSY